MSVAMTCASYRNSTYANVPDGTVAVSAREELTGIAVEVGARASVTPVEVTACTVTGTAADVAVSPLESVTRAVSVKLPGAVGVHVVANGPVPATVAIADPFTRNWTCVTVAPIPAVAVAVNDTGVFTVVMAPGDGAVIVTVGPPPETFTLTGFDVLVSPAESVTRALSANAPTEVGVHEMV